MGKYKALRDELAAMNDTYSAVDCAGWLCGHIPEILAALDEAENHSGYVERTASIARDFGAMESRAIFAEKRIAELEDALNSAREDNGILDEKVNDLSAQLSRRADDIETEVRNAAWESERAQKAESEISALKAQLADYKRYEPDAEHSDCSAEIQKLEAALQKAEALLERYCGDYAIIAYFAEREKEKR